MGAGGGVGGKGPAWKIHIQVMPMLDSKQ